VGVIDRKNVFLLAVVCGVCEFCCLLPLLNAGPVRIIPWEVYFRVVIFYPLMYFPIGVVASLLLIREGEKILGGIFLMMLLFTAPITLFPIGPPGLVISWFAHI